MRVEQPHLSIRRTASVIGLCIALLVASDLLFNSAAKSFENTNRPAASRYGNATFPSHNLKVNFDLVMQPSSQFALESFITQVSEPMSSSYRHYLSPTEFASRFGPTKATVKGLANYFKRYGLSVGKPWSGGVVMPVSGSVSDAAKALRVSFGLARIHGAYIPEANGQWRIPSQLEADLVSVIGIYPDGNVPNYRRVNDMTRLKITNANVKQSSRLSHSLSRLPRLCQSGEVQAASLGAYLPSTFAGLYGMNSFYAKNDFGAGTTIAIPEFAATTPTKASYQFRSHLNKYLGCIGSRAKVDYISIDGGSSDRSPASLEEAELDTETVLSLAPSATVQIYSAPQASGDQMYLKMVSNDSASIIVGSWGLCEGLNAPSDLNVENLAFKEAAAQGQTVLFASGDGGSEDCYLNGTNRQLAVDDPASQPYVTGVGGLMLSPGSANGEKVWFDKSYGGASGGGVSLIHTQPVWQSGPGVDSQQAIDNCVLATVCREVPDISALAEGFLVYAPKYGWDVLGGTSGAAPVVAAGVALIESQIHHRLGLLTPLLYSLSRLDPSVISDVKLGENDYLKAHGGIYSATQGYDPASGLGFVHFDRLLNALGRIS